MSRAPRNDRSIPLSAALGNNIGIIDFIDAPMAGLQTAAAGAAAVPPGMVMGGPPAYLEAHGIRYVPASMLGAETASFASVEALDSSPDSAESLDAEPTYVSQQDLEARVDDRIRQFMRRTAGGPKQQETARAAPSIASRADDVRTRLKQLRDECSAATLASSAPSGSSGRVLRSGRRIPGSDYDY